MPKKKYKPLDADFYINEVGVLDWLKSNEPQKIRFVDRIEYKENNLYHRPDGPAIEFFSGVGNQFFLKGVRIEADEYTNYLRTRLIDRMSNES